MDWIHDYPSWLVGSGIVVSLVGAAIVGLAATRRWSRERGLHALVDNGVIGWIFSAILGMYAIAIGLIAVASWGNASAAAAIASHEAAEIAAFYRDLGGYPEPPRRALLGTLHDYAVDVIENAWPLQRRGEIPHTGTDLLNRIEVLLYRFEPATEAHKIIHAEALASFNRLIEYRRQRLEAVKYAIPATLWAVLMIGAALSIAASYVFNMESFRVHAVMTGLLAAMIALLVFFIAITDLPYRGRSGVSPEAYQLVLGDLVEEDAPH
jgi:hypothetical protein